MSSAIATPATPAAGSYTSSNSNASVGLPTSGANANYSSGGTLTVPGGNYVLNSMNISGTTLQFTGPTTIWMYGSVSLSGSSLLAYQNKPTNLQIKFCTSAGFNLSGSAVYAVVTAPTTPANLNASSNLVGSIIASQISLNASSIYFDKQLGTNGDGGGGGSTIVQ